MFVCLYIYNLYIYVYIWMDGWMDGWMDKWMDEWINGWMDRWVDRGWITYDSCLLFVRRKTRQYDYKSYGRMIASYYRNRIELHVSHARRKAVIRSTVHLTNAIRERRIESTFAGVMVLDPFSMLIRVAVGLRLGSTICGTHKCVDAGRGWLLNPRVALHGACTNC